MKKLLFTLLVFTFSFSFGQLKQGAFILGGNYNDQGNSIIKTNDDGYAIAGTEGGSKVYIIKLDSNFNAEWSRIIGGKGTDWGSSIIQDLAGDYIVTGYSTSYGAGGADVYVLKLDQTGNVIWTRTIGGTSNDYGNSIIQAKDGDYVIAGYTLSYGAGNSDVYVIKMDTAGNLQWTKTIGGTGDDVGNSILQNNSGDFIVAGYTTSYGAGSDDVYVIKLDSAGSLKWTKTIGGTGDDEGNSIAQTLDGDYAIAGLTQSYGVRGGYNTYIVKLDTSGNIKHTAAIGGAGEDAYSITATADGGMAVAGYTYVFGDGGTGSVYVLKLDSTCTLENSRAEGFYYNFGYSIVQTNDKGYAVVGSGEDDSTAGVFVLKFDFRLNICLPIFTGGVDSTGGIEGSGGGAIGSGGAITSRDSGKSGPYGKYSNICSLLTSEPDVSPPISSVRVYPNPSKGIFTIESSGIIPIAIGNQPTIEVYNMLGEKVYSNQFLIPIPIGTNSNPDSYRDLINLSGQPPGIYLYRITSEKGELIGSGKLEISK